MIKHRRVFSRSDNKEFASAEEARREFLSAIDDYLGLETTFSAEGEHGNTVRVLSTKDGARHFVLLETENYDVLHELPSRSTAIVQACGHITGYL
jgi:hypothetical protein